MYPCLERGLVLFCVAGLFGWERERWVFGVLFWTGRLVVLCVTWRPPRFPNLTRLLDGVGILRGGGVLEKLRGPKEK